LSLTTLLIYVDDGMIVGNSFWWN